MSLDSDYKIPADVDAAVKSVSAVGEQYVDLIPRDGAAEADGPYLANGDVIPLDRASIPQDVGEMLDQADELLASISDTRLQTVIDEAFTAFNGSGPDLQRLIDSARLFVEEADANSDATKALIDQVGPLLDTQTVSSDAIRSWTRDLVTFTDQLRASDPNLRSVLEKGPGAAQEATQLFQDLQPTLPILLRNLVSVGQVGVIYNKSIEQVLVIYPPLTAALVTAAKGGPVEDGAIVDFALQLHDPPRVHDRIPAPGATPVRRSDRPDRHPERPVLQGRPGRPVRGPWCAEPAVHGVPRTSRTDRRGVPRGLGGDGQQPAVRAHHAAGCTLVHSRSEFLRRRRGCTGRGRALRPGHR